MSNTNQTEKIIKLNNIYVNIKYLIIEIVCYHIKTRQGKS